MTYLHTFMHAEPYRSTFLIILHTILNGKCQFVPHAAYTINTFSANPFHSKTYQHTH